MGIMKRKEKKIEDQEIKQEELSIDDLGIVTGTGEFDEVPTVKEGDYDDKIRKTI
jgi:hypothetical protein